MCYFNFVINFFYLNENYEKQIKIPKGHLSENPSKIA